MSLIDLEKYESALKRCAADGRPLTPVQPIPFPGQKRSPSLLKALKRNRAMAKDLYQKYERMMK